MNKIIVGVELYKINDLRKKVIFLCAYTIIVFSFRYFDVTCLIYRVTGIPCPGCGITRACLSALRFNFVEAFAYNPMFWSVPILLLYFIFDGNIIKSKFANKLIFSLIVFGFIVTWLLKIIDLY